MGSGIRGRTKGEEKRGPGELRGWPESGRTPCLQNMERLCGTFLEAGDSSGALEMNQGLISMFSGEVTGRTWNTCFWDVGCRVPSILSRSLACSN